MIEMRVFTLNLSDIIQICNEEYILNTNVLIKCKLEDNIYQKTFLEIIIDICFHILLNNKFLTSHKLTYDCLNKCIFNPDITPKGFTIFYYNDILYNSKKSEKAYKNILLINNIFLIKNKEKFEMSFLTFALLKLSSYYIYLKENIIKLNDDLNIYLETLINKLLKEHFELYLFNSDIFSKASNNKLYEKLKEEILNYITAKNKTKGKNTNLNIFSDFQNFFTDNLSNINSVSEEITSDICNTEKNKNQVKIKNSSGIPQQDINDKILEGRNINFSKNITVSTNENTFSNNNDNQNNNIKSIFDLDEAEIENEDKINLDFNFIEEEDIINNKDIEEIIIKDYISEDQEINISKLTKSTYFLEDIDEYYISNIKKDIMNNIFSFYFIDTFFSNKLFRKMKLIYFNDYPDANSKTKSLNFPSKLKTFNNGLEPDNILKLNYKFFSDKYFPVSHPYFYEYMQKNNIPPNKYIKLFHKNIDFSKNENIIKLDCELIKLDKNYFGELFCFFEEEENKRILLFHEKKFDFNNFDESIFDNEENSKNIFSLSFITQKLKQGKTKSTYKNQFKRKEKLVIIHFSDIDEIIEKRCLLLWQAVEIYLKNGKSYFLNILSEDNKNLLIKELEKDLNIQNLIHKKDFFF